MAARNPMPTNTAAMMMMGLMGFFAVDSALEAEALGVALLLVVVLRVTVGKRKGVVVVVGVVGGL